MTMNDAAGKRCIAVTHVSPSPFILPPQSRGTGIISATIEGKSLTPSPVPHGTLFLKKCVQ